MRSAKNVGWLLMALLCPLGAESACPILQTINQPESRDAAGKITVDASIIRVVNCDSRAGTPQQFYIY